MVAIQMGLSLLLYREKTVFFKNDIYIYLLINQGQTHLHFFFPNAGKQLAKF